MDWKQYEKEIQDLAVYPKDADNLTNPDFFPLMYLGLGLAGETGEVVDEIKKCLRNDLGEFTEERYLKIITEMGDQMWYFTRIITHLRIWANDPDLTLEDIMLTNVEKLNKRALEKDLRHE